MKIISLNTWGGRIHKPLKDFLKENSDVDIFCFQEVLHRAEGKVDYKEVNPPDPAMNLFEDISQQLPEHRGFFRPHVEEFYGLAMFIRKDREVLEEGEKFVHLHKGFVPEADLGHHARNVQFVKIKNNERYITVINFHGLWNGQGKGDSEERIDQTKNVLEFLKKVDTEAVLCGDFNLLPDTESIRMFEAFGLKNLIKEYGIASTRTSFYTKDVKFADYAFVTKGVGVTEFKVLPDEVSDHAPLLLEIK